MAHETQSYMDMLRKFADGMGLPKLDVDKLIESQRKNLDALGQSAKVAAEGAQSVAQMVKAFQPLGNPQETVAKQTELARKVFDVALHGAQETAQMARQSTSDAVKIIQDRLKESLEEFRDSVSRANGGHGKK